jgi:fucose permease
MPAPSRRHDSLLVQCLVYASFGTPIGMLGAGWPDGRHLFHRSAGSLGLVAAVYGMGRLATSQAALPVLRRWRIGVATATLGGLLGVTCLAVAATRSYAVLAVAFALIGTTSGVLDALGNRYQTVVRNVGHAGLMFGSYGIGATLGPLVIALVGWGPGFTIAGALAACAGALALSPQVRWPDALRAGEPPRGARGRVEVAPSILAVSLAVFAIYCSAEIATANWTASYLEGARGLSGSGAAWATSGFWAGMTLGRLVLGRFVGPGRALTPTRFLIGAGVAVGLGFVAIPLVPAAVAVGAFAWVGLALAGLFPTLMSTTADRVGVANAGRVMGWQLLAANLTGLTLSAAVGVGVDRIGAGTPAVVLAVMGVAGLPLLVRSATWHARDHASSATVVDPSGAVAGGTAVGAATTATPEGAPGPAG